MTLTEKQRAALKVLPDQLGSALPAALLADLFGVSRGVLAALFAKGLAEREQPNEEWPFVYARSDAGRAALEQGGQS